VGLKSVHNPIHWIMGVNNTLFVVRQSKELCIVPLLQEGKTQLPYNVFGVQYGYGNLWFFTERGLEIYKPTAFESL